MTAFDRFDPFDPIEQRVMAAIDEIAARLRVDHHATLLSINRGGRAFINPSAEFRLESGDDAVVVADGARLGPFVLAENVMARSEDVLSGPSSAVSRTT
jgi:hypothetical protein